MFGDTAVFTGFCLLYDKFAGKEPITSQRAGRSRGNDATIMLCQSVTLIQHVAMRLVFYCRFFFVHGEVKMRELAEIQC